EEGEVAVEEVAGQEEEDGGEDPGERSAAHGSQLAPANEENLGHFISWGPVQCSGAARPARFRCPQTPSASVSALALGLPLSWGPVRCSGAARPARFRCPQTPSANVSALALGLPFSWGPVRCSRAARAALLRRPRPPSARSRPPAR